MDEYLAFTLKSTGIMRKLTTDTYIDSNVRDENKNFDKNKTWCGLWDTGATQSSIKQQIVDELGLNSVGTMTISTANGIAEVDAYNINITLPNHVTVTNVIVSCSDLGEDTDLLIGMDIIQHGDFVITNTNNSTTFSFCVPSISEVDFVEQIHKT